MKTTNYKKGSLKHGNLLSYVFHTGGVLFEGFLGALFIGSRDYFDFACTGSRASVKNYTVNKCGAETLGKDFGSVFVNRHDIGMTAFPTQIWSDGGGRGDLKCYNA